MSEKASQIIHVFLFFFQLDAQLPEIPWGERQKEIMTSATVEIHSYYIIRREFDFR